MRLVPNRRAAAVAAVVTAAVVAAAVVAAAAATAVVVVGAAAVVAVTNAILKLYSPPGSIPGGFFKRSIGLHASANARPRSRANWLGPTAL
jgi:hypothetical protein